MRALQHSRDSRSSGFTLIEVLIAMAIFAVGSLGVLAMVTTTLRLNVNSRQTIEANQLAIFMAERLQVMPNSDTELTGCTLASPCFLTAALGQQAGETTVTPANVMGVGSGLHYQVWWRAAAISGTNPRYIEIRVFWPKNRDLAGGTWSGLNCHTTGGMNCYSTQIFTYR